MLRAYDMAVLDPEESRRVRVEASIGRSLGDLPGIVPTLSISEDDEWAFIETPLTGQSLQAHLERVGTGTESRLSAESYADALAGVASTLQQLHDRGLVHRNVRPLSLIGDPTVERLLLTGFSTASHSRSDRYVAPEQFAGEMGPSLDQYALGVTAHDVFAAPDAPPLTAPVHRVLQRATNPQPGDRFTTIAEFGAALAAAVRQEAPRGFADRLAAASPTNRATVWPAAVAAGIGLAFGIATSVESTLPPELCTFLTTGVALIYAGFAWFAVFAAGAIRGRRRRASLGFVNRPAAPFVAFLAVTAVLLLAGGEPFAVIFFSLIGTYSVRSLLAPAPSTAGSWLVGALRWWDRRRALSPRRRKLIGGAILAAAVALLATPALAVVIWPGETVLPTRPVRAYEPLVSVWRFRAALRDGDFEKACAEAATAPTHQARRGCMAVARRAASVQSRDPAFSAVALPFGAPGSLDRYRVQVQPSGGAEFGLWGLIDPAGRDAGSMYTEGLNGDRVMVLLSRERPALIPGPMRSLWGFQLRLLEDGWQIVRFRACRLRPPGTGLRPAKCVVSGPVQSGQPS